MCCFGLCNRGLHAACKQPLPLVPHLSTQQCEDLEDAASLAHLYRIIRSAIMLNDATLLEELLKEVRSRLGVGVGSWV